MSSTMLSGEGDEFRRADEVALLEEALRREMELSSRQAKAGPAIGTRILMADVFGKPGIRTEPFVTPVSEALDDTYPYFYN